MTRRRNASTLAGVLTVLALTLALALPTASGRSSFPSAPAAKQPPKSKRSTSPAATPRPCKGPDVVWGTDRGETKSDYDPNGVAKGVIICALDGHDHIYVGGENTIVWAGAGDDEIHAKTQGGGKPKAQIIMGESGSDSVLDKDSVDQFYEEAFPKPRSSQRDSQRAPQGGAQGYPGTQPRVQCINNQGFWQMYFDPPPVMRAYNVSGKVDWQYVAWSPVLSKANPTTNTWDFFNQNEWLWDLANEGARVYFSGNTWRRFGNNASPELDPSEGSPWRLWFNIKEPGLYRIAVYYHHYAVGSRSASQVYTWVDHHRGEFSRRAPDGYEYCAFGV